MFPRTHASSPEPARKDHAVRFSPAVDLAFRKRKAMQHTTFRCRPKTCVLHSAVSEQGVLDEPLGSGDDLVGLCQVAIRGGLVPRS